jgi:hypothetical protein
VIGVGFVIATLSCTPGICGDYLDRSDTITSGVADATETNKAVQSITRWPRASRYDRWVTDGERARTAIVRYKTGRAIPPRTLSSKVDADTTPPPPPDTPVEGGPAAVAGK